MANSNLTSAKRAKNDEFYTRLEDIQNEVNAYLELNPNVFEGKVVYCNCDDPLESNFFGFFALKFKELKLKRLITTSYKPSPIAGTLFDITPYETTPKGRQKATANRFIIDDVGDINNDGSFDLTDIHDKLRANKHNEWEPLSGDSEYPAGDFRSKECVELLKQSDIVVTNPPFSLYREYVSQLIQYGKKFVIIGSKNTITYKEVFPLIKDNKMWVGTSSFSRDILFIAPKNADLSDKPKSAVRLVEGITYLRSPSVWFTNLDHGRRHQPLSLMTMVDNHKFNKKVIKSETAYKRYDNYDAIEVPFTDAIPSDYNGVMGVPISFLDKYNPEQFQIIGSDAYDGTPATKKYAKKEKVSNGQRMKSQTGTMGCVIRRDEFGQGTYFDVGYPVQAVYKRIFIKHRKATT